MSKSWNRLHNGFAVASRIAAFVALFGLGLSAHAHVNYVDLSDPLLSPNGVNGSSFSNNGWYLGTTTALGDSHSLAGGDFFKFHLGQTSVVSITFSDISYSPGLLNPAFSVYRGLLPDEAHDDTTFDPLNPRSATFPFPKIASPVDNGVLSPFRDTAHVNYDGQFDALHGWSMANQSGEWGVVQYVTHVGPSGGTSVSLTGYTLGPGDYTIAAAGGMAIAADSPNVLTGLDGQIQLTVTPVPEPEMAWLMLAGLALVGVAKRRRSA